MAGFCSWRAWDQAHPSREAALRATASPADVDLELVLAVDTSGSMDIGKRACSASAIWNAPTPGIHQRRQRQGRIAVGYFEWKGAYVKS